MRILILSPTYAPVIGGLESYLLTLVDLLRRRDCSHIVMTGGSAELSVDPGGVKRIPWLDPASLLSAKGDSVDDLDEQTAGKLAEAIAYVVEGFGPDVISVHNGQHFGPELGVAALRSRNGRPVVNMVHDHSGPHISARALGLPWHSTVHVSSFVSRALPVKGRSTVIHPGVDSERFRSGVDPDRQIASLSRPVIFHPARLLAWKGVEDSVAALAILKRTHPDATLVLTASNVVSGSESNVADLRRTLEGMASRLGVSESVRFIDRAFSDMAAAYAACDVVWYPTRTEEPFGLVPLEAMACGQIVIASTCGGIRETIVHGSSGLLVPRRSPAQLAATTAGVLGDAAQQKRLRSGAATRAEAFSAEKHVDRLLRHFESVISAV